MKHKKLSAIVVTQALILALCVLPWATPAAAQSPRNADITAGALGTPAHLADLAFQRVMGWLQNLWAADGGAGDPNGSASNQQAPPLTHKALPIVREWHNRK